ncbi:MAG: c-type cytochrome [Chitinophagaceae bacterium]|nr:c-type cytochrome [Oligoflexus sp.]
MLVSPNALKAGAKYKDLYKRPTQIPYPSSNTYSDARMILGRTLFFDPRLSGSNWISCATCHNPAFSWGDGLAKGIGDGMKDLSRRTPTILNLAWGELMFWDGRAESLEAQALGPVASTGEMNLPIDQLLAKISKIQGYKTLFKGAYPEEGITKDTISKAIATFERSVVSGKAPFDRWIEGDETAISEKAKHGFTLFNEKASCSQCHSGWRFTDEGFYDIGLAGDDKGRGKILGDIETLQYAFKTPTLRNVDHRAPYMHNGSETSLTKVVDFYNKGGDVTRGSKSEHVKPLLLSDDEKDALIAFLKTLTSIDAATPVTMLPR